MSERKPVYRKGCGPDCPCQQRRLTDFPVFSTGDRYVLVGCAPDYRGLLLTEERAARTRFFKWVTP